MAVVTMPTDLAVSTCTTGQVRYDMAEASDASGDVAVRTFGPPRWKLSMGSPSAMNKTLAGKWHAMLLQLRGRVNTLAAHDPVRTLPAGTMRIAPIIGANAAAGATSITLANAVGTLLQGDRFQIGTGLGTSQVVEVMADATSTVLAQASPDWVNGSAQVVTWVNGSSAVVGWVNGGTVTVTVEPPLRAAYAPGTAVNLDRPVIYCKATNSQTDWAYRQAGGGLEEGFSIDLLEVFG